MFESARCRHAGPAVCISPAACVGGMSPAACPSAHLPALSLPAVARRISTPAWEQLRSSCRGGPELAPSDACPTCLAAHLDGVAAGHETEASTAGAACCCCWLLLSFYSCPPARPSVHQGCTPLSLLTASVGILTIHTDIVLPLCPNPASRSCLLLPCRASVSTMWRWALPWRGERGRHRACSRTSTSASPGSGGL